ncbi:TylF/MycF/NovP-related O-methyltransferase [Acanthopleuribacter pedis]|uniref:Class I SAM-dependent methyltransferase n=1 Tax=Acanthopleuribacter pedis TaxID=442870 RepID=A0A8J7Q081_9BACT|nr:TylF/MycF/NovP-related O-methyltransferase [Acanthopleuribacter pedis]MBO1318007.1 class I SAM-dependent methyltransferase [Acanthopleuribacter pedis]
MIQLPDFQRAFDYENNFYLSAHPSRFAKFLAHADLFRKIQHLKGAVVECGVFKGTSLIGLATLRHLLDQNAARPIIGFDTFDLFPETQFEADQAKRQGFIDEAGDQSIGVDQLHQVLRHKGIDQNIALVAGDILHTLPAWCSANPDQMIALINLDTDIYEPAQIILEYLWPRLEPGGILLLDDYGVFPGETQAADEFFGPLGLTIASLPYRETPRYVVKPHTDS